MRKVKRPYASAVREQVEKANLQAGAIYTLDVRHDDWCRLLKGKGSLQLFSGGMGQKILVTESGEVKKDDLYFKYTKLFYV